MQITNAKTIIDINTCLLTGYDAYFYYDEYDHIQYEITAKNKKTVIFDDFKQLKQYIIDNNLFKTN